MADLSPVEHRPKVLRLKEVVKETPTIKSLYFDCQEIASKCHPGQFVMVWVIGEDEIPMSVSEINGSTLGITVANVGDATSRLHELEVGDPVGIRGPYGNWFDLSKSKLLMIGGGYGVAPLAFGTEVALSEGKKVTVALGAKTSDELLFQARLESLGADVIVVTEDGSTGGKGLVTDILEGLLEKERFDCIYSCGPEPMLKSAFEIAVERDIEFQASLERRIKCSVGICGSCLIGPYRVCLDGPIFSTDELLEVKDEFGVFEREASGKKIKFSNRET